MPTLTPEEFVEDVLDSLMHEYDPVKAREYYLRTRQLKGRKRSVQAPATFIKRTPKPTAESRKAKAARMKAASEKRVAQLKARLEKLEKALDKLMREIRAKNGPETDKKASSAKDAKPLTAAQKRDAAKRAKERREKEAKEPPSSQEKALEAKIKRVRERIEKMKAELASARKKNGATSKTKTASNGR